MSVPRIAGTAIAICVALALSACVTQPPEPQSTAPLVWPSVPDEPRIAYVASVTRPEDLGIAKGFFRRVVDALFGAEDARIVRPMAVAAVGQVLYVADPGAKGVHRFDRASGEYDLLRAEGGAALPSPVGLARGADGTVYVTDSSLGKVYLLRPQAKFAVPVALGAPLGQPTGVAFDPVARRLYVADTAAHRVNVFRADGSLEAAIGQRGRGDGEFNYPTLLWRTGQGRLYVTDSLNFRVQAFDERGAFATQFGRLGDRAGDLARHKGVATDSYGHVYVVDGQFHAVQVFDAAGRFLLSVGGLGRQRGEFWLPAGIFIDEDDTIYVADSYNQRVQIFRYVGGAT